MFVTYFTGVITVMTVFLLGCLGEILTEKGGHLNMGTPGIMCMGATGAAVGGMFYLNAIGGSANANMFMGIFMPTLFCLIFAGITGLLYCFLVDTLQCNQNVTGLTITTLGVGIFPFVVNVIGNNGLPDLCNWYFVSMLPRTFFKSNWFTEMFLSYSFLTYLAIIIAVILFFVLRRTRVGLSLRAVGENPGTADSTGINVTRYKYVSTLIGSMISGLGGLFYLMVMTQGALQFSVDTFGWLAVALVIFSMWNPALSILGSFIFAAFYQLPSFIPGVSGAPAKVISTLPYIVTIIVLIIISLFNKKESQGPAGLGLPYYREDR